MPRTTIVFSISLPPEMVKTLDELMKKEHRTRSELIREALRRYVEKFFIDSATKGATSSLDFSE